MPIITRELHKRLRKLESSRPRHRPELTEEEKRLKYARHLIWFAVAQHLGDPNPREAPITAYARALGYEHGDYLKILKLIASGGKDPDYDQKYALANRKLFAKFGVELDTSDRKKTVDWKKTEEALKRMEAGLSEDYRQRLLSSYRDRSRLGGPA
jgi:hypothetical protein